MECESNKIQYDYSKLNGKIREVFGKCSAFAAAMNMSERTLSLKLNNKRYWKQPEMELACSLLGISHIEMWDYFFVQKVQTA